MEGIILYNEFEGRKKLAGGEISTLCLPTVREITDEKQHLVESGELSLGEPCTPYIIKKSIATSTAEIENKSTEVYGRKIPLYELRQYLLAKQEKYMSINMPGSSETEFNLHVISVQGILAFGMTIP